MQNAPCHSSVFRSVPSCHPCFPYSLTMTIIDYRGGGGGGGGGNDGRSLLKMAGTPVAVMEMLGKAKNDIAHKAKKETELLRKAKVEIEGPHSLPVQPWDLSYYMNLVRHKNSAKDIGSTLSMRTFLSLDNCVYGLGILYQNLFGIQLRRLSVPSSENWTMQIGGQEDDDNNNGLIKIELSHSAHGPLGTVFLDLIARPGKVIPVTFKL